MLHSIFFNIFTFIIFIARTILNLIIGGMNALLKVCTILDKTLLIGLVLVVVVAVTALVNIYFPFSRELLEQTTYFLSAL